MKNHGLVTELTPTCQLSVAAGNRSVSEEEAAQRRAKRLEDVEKFVRSHDWEIGQLIDQVVMILDWIDRHAETCEHLFEGPHGR